MNIEEAVKARIAALNTAAGDRIYREIIEEEPTLPAIAISRSGGAPSARESSGAGLIHSARITVGIVGWTQAAVMPVAQQLAPSPAARAAGAPIGLDGWRTEQGDPVILSCLLRSQLEQPEIDGDHTLRVVLQDYEIKFR